ncbi:hypothetical protein EBY67_07145, partial [bacterium]|nr:hypothetical protein [bacterium]
LSILNWTKHHSFSLVLIFLSLTAPHLHAATLAVKDLSDSITIHLGIGANVSYLAFDESTLGPKPIIYAWRYDNLTDGTPRTGTDLLNAVISETAGTTWTLSYTVGAYGLTTSYSIGSATSTEVDPLSSPVWTYWIQGGTEFVEFGDNGSFTFSVGNSFIVSPTSSDTRYLTNGSYDAWTITPFSFTGTSSDTRYFTDTLGNSQPVSDGVYTGSAPTLRTAPTAQSVRALPNAQLEITFTVIEGALYQLEEQESLSPNGWQNRGESFTATSSQKIFILPTDNPSKKGFFRLQRKE